MRTGNGSNDADFEYKGSTSYDTDAGTGYDYLLISIETNGVDPTTETLAIDEFELFAE